MSYPLTTPPLLSSSLLTPNLQRYFCLHTSLAEHAQNIARQPGVAQHLARAVDPSRDQRISSLVALSAIAGGPLLRMTGLRLPDLSTVMREASKRQDGAERFREVVGSITDSLAVIDQLINTPHGPALTDQVHALLYL